MALNTPFTCAKLVAFERSVATRNGAAEYGPSGRSSSGERRIWTLASAPGASGAIVDGDTSASHGASASSMRIGPVASCPALRSVTDTKVFAPTSMSFTSGEGDATRSDSSGTASTAATRCWTASPSIDAPKVAAPSSAEGSAFTV